MTAMPRTTRTFVGLPIPPDRASALGRLQASLAPDLPEVRWTDPALFHVTLAFLGDVDDTRLDAVGRAVAEGAAGFAPFELELEGVGAFPDARRPRVVWAGLAGEGLGPLDELRKAVVAALKRVRQGPEDDRFHPHITLGRLKGGRGPGPDATPVIDRHRGWSAGPFAVEEVITFASSLGPKGPSYTPLARARLEGGKTESPP
jgi:2'-5' RNA ligase